MLPLARGTYYLSRRPDETKKMKLLRLTELGVSNGQIELAVVGAAPSAIHGDVRRIQIALGGNPITGGMTNTSQVREVRLSLDCTGPNLPCCYKDFQ